MTELLFRHDAYLRECEAVVVALADGAVELDRTVCYPMGGGQPGDTGVLLYDDGRELQVVDTRKGEAPDQVWHRLAEGSALPAVGERVTLRRDWDRRYAHMRYHTALHLLCAVVAAPVTGGQVAGDKARLDFAVEMDALDKDRIEAGLNALVAAGHVVSARWVEESALDANPGREPVHPIFALAFALLPDEGQGASRAAVRVPQAACNAAVRRRDGEPVGPGWQRGIRFVMCLGNSPAIASGPCLAPAPLPVRRRCENRVNRLHKTMSVAPPRGAGMVRLIEVAGADLQPCGGTHVRNTAEIGPLLVQKIRSEGKQNKRVIIAFAG